MKKSSMIIYMLMILIGGGGVFYYMGSEQNSDINKLEEERAISSKKNITVAISSRDLPTNSILTSDDFKLKNISVESDSKDIQFDIKDMDLVHWVLKNEVASGSYFLPDSLIKPGSEHYISLFHAPGNILYPFELDDSDNYLLTNLKPGASIDIYLSYSLHKDERGNVAVSSPAKSIHDTRIKPLIANKRILAIRTVNESKDTKHSKNINQLIIELKDSEIKLLKGLEGHARMIVFPATIGIINSSSAINKKLLDKERIWPVSNDPLFDESQLQPAHEWRG